MLTFSMLKNTVFIAMVAKLLTLLKMELKSIQIIITTITMDMLTKRQNFCLGTTLHLVTSLMEQ